MCSSSVLKLLSSSLCLLLCLPPSLSSSDHKDVTVKPGENTTLHCRSSGKVEVVQIQWIRPDLKSEEFVYLYTDSQFNKDSQLLSYRGRAELKDPEKKDGDVSVILKNVTFNDTGRYECHIRNTGSDLKLISSIYLTVQDSVNKTAEPGQSVSLPCRAPSDTEITTAEWTRPGLEPEYVLMIREKKLVLDDQHQAFKDRVELKDREMKDGDVSMILKNVTRDDSGTYKCRVFLKETESSSGSIEPISIVDLQVHQSGDTGGRGGDKEGGDKEGGDSRGHFGLFVVFIVVVVVVSGFIISGISNRSIKLC